MAQVRPATIADAVSIAPRLRQADQQEISASLGIPAEFALVATVHHSKVALAIEEDGEVIGLFGADPIPVFDNTAQVWMVMTDAIHSISMQFLREGGEWLERLHEVAPLLTNYTDKRNTLHHRWLRWLGFTFIGEHAYGRQGEPFYQFVRLKPCAYQP